MSRVVVLGSSGFDLTIRLSRLPRPGETLLGGELHTGPGGKGANAAIAAKRAGAEVIFLTAFGDDDFGRQIREHDLREGLDLSHARIVVSSANQVALIFVGEDGQNLIGVAPGASSSLSPEDIDALPDAVFSAGGVLLTCLEIPAATVARGLRRAKTGGMITILNPAPADPATLDAGLLADVDWLTPNEEEARVLIRRSTASPSECLDGLRQAGAGGVILTLGGEGALIAPPGEEPTRLPAFAVDVVDTVGAGDAFNGALAAALAERLPIRLAARRAAAAGALAVTKSGAQGALPTRIQIDNLIRRG